MKITFEIDEVQEGKNYVVEFCVSENGVTKKSTTTRKNTPKEKKKTGPSLDDFESDAPKLEEPKKGPADFKVESSFDGKINPT
jgi:hypothetical protein